MKEKFQKAYELIQQSHNILITGHTRPDGDSCGSISALGRLATAMGKNVIPFLITPCSIDMEFLFEGLAHYTADPDYDISEQINHICEKIDLVLIVDTNSRDQLPRFDKWLEQSASPVIIFDHHITSDGLGEVEMVDTEATAAGEIVCRFFDAQGLEITPEIARCLFAAIASDTGWFRFGSRRRSCVYSMAARLIEKGADPSEIYSSLYQQMSEGRVRLGARAIDSMLLHFGGLIAFQQLLLNDFAATGTSGIDTGGIVQQPHNISKVDTSVIFIEQPDGKFKCSMRSKGRVNVRLIAQKYGGGGHNLAAGATIQKPLDRLKAMILEDIKSQLNQY